MISIRHSPATRQNDAVQEVPARSGESNRQWLSRVGATEGIVLLGGSSVAHFRIRVAQSHVRQDLSPALWSLTGILVDQNTLLSVPLDWRGDASEIPRTNGVQTSALDRYDDAERFPNIAVLRFATATAPIRAHAERVQAQRSVIDLPSLMVPWLAYIWSAGEAGNPLLAGHGLPCAVFVETVYGIAGIELTPGLSSTSSCPEAIWQAARWWHEFYAETPATGRGERVGPIVPTGQFALRQRAAAVAA